MYESQTDKSPSIRAIRIQCRTCAWKTWTTPHTLANNWRFECGECGVRSAEGQCRWYMDKIFSYLANELKTNPKKAVKFSKAFRNWLKKVKSDEGLYVQFKKRWPDWLKERDANLELDGYSEFIEIAFEYNGKQHYNIHTMRKVWCGNDKELGRHVFRQQWNNDRQKVAKCADRETILIVVPYRVKPLDFQKFIILEFKRFTGINLSVFNIPMFDFYKRSRLLRDPDQRRLDTFL